MVRIVFIGLALCFSLYCIIQIMKAARRGDLDWRSVGVAAAFVILAIYLRQVTDIGGLV